MSVALAEACASTADAYRRLSTAWRQLKRLWRGSRGWRKHIRRVKQRAASICS